MHLNPSCTLETGLQSAFCSPRAVKEQRTSPMLSSKAAAPCAHTGLTRPFRGTYMADRAFVRGLWGGQAHLHPLPHLDKHGFDECGGRSKPCLSYGQRDRPSFAGGSRWFCGRFGVINRLIRVFPGDALGLKTASYRLVVEFNRCLTVPWRCETGV